MLSKTFETAYGKAVELYKGILWQVLVGQISAIRSDAMVLMCLQNARGVSSAAVLFTNLIPYSAVSASVQQ